MAAARPLRHLICLDLRMTRVTWGRGRFDGTTVLWLGVPRRAAGRAAGMKATIVLIAVSGPGDQGEHDETTDEPQT